MATMHFHKVQTCVSFWNIFRIKGALAPVINCSKGARKAKLDDIRGIRHLLTNFRKNGLFLVALNLNQKVS